MFHVGLVAVCVHVYPETRHVAFGMHLPSARVFLEPCQSSVENVAVAEIVPSVLEVVLSEARHVVESVFV